MLWRDQIVRDISLVIDQDEFAQEQLTALSASADLSTMSDAIADLYYQAIDSALENHGSMHMIQLGRSLIGEICSNLGVDVFDDLAAEWVQ